MKSIVRVLCITFAVMFVFSDTYAQKKGKAFNGTVLYEITYPEAEIDPAMAGQLPTQMTVIINETKQKTEISTGMMSNIVIIDMVTNKTVILLDLMGQKFAIRSSKEEMQSKQETTPNVKVTEETKEIAGYKCKKVEVTSEDSDDPMIVWVTDEILGDYDNWAGSFPGVKGLAMEYIADNNGMKMKMSVQTVTPGKFKDKDFLIPSDFKEVTAEELQEIFGGMGGE
ncbi:MAG: DUF4412 domain-containing protein [Bacteroidetes bacterium]|nr:DUF4412 domain-containing protein [Bacteroidota bacterium]MBU1719065.1 DUF4412 domain-containing protein [Bacteroidota bacterium]